MLNSLPRSVFMVFVYDGYNRTKHWVKRKQRPRFASALVYLILTTALYKRIIYCVGPYKASLNYKRLEDNKSFHSKLTRLLIDDVLYLPRKHILKLLAQG